MICDTNNQLADNQAISVATATFQPTESSIDVGGTSRSALTHPEGTATGNVLNTLAAGSNLQRDIAEGEPLYVVFTITTAFAGVTSVNFSIISATNEALTAGVRTMIKSDNIAVANLTAGTQVVMRVQFDPANKNDTLERYFGAGCTGVGGTTLTGNWDVHLVHGNQAGGKKFYPTATIIAHKTTAS